MMDLRVSHAVHALFRRDRKGDKLREVSTIVPDLSGDGPKRSGGFAATISRNIVASLARVAVVSLSRWPCLLISLIIYRSLRMPHGY